MAGKPIDVKRFRTFSEIPFPSRGQLVWTDVKGDFEVLRAVGAFYPSIADEPLERIGDYGSVAGYRLALAEKYEDVLTQKATSSNEADLYALLDVLTDLTRIRLDSGSQHELRTAAKDKSFNFWDRPDILEARYKIMTHVVPLLEEVFRNQNVNGNLRVPFMAFARLCGVYGLPPDALGIPAVDDGAPQLRARLDKLLRPD